jgi:hypothetical protein
MLLNSNKSFHGLIWQQYDMENKINRNKNLTISAILVILGAAAITLTSNTSAGNDVFAYSNSPQTQNQANNCKIGTVGGATCGINGVQTQGDGTVSSPVLSQTSDVIYLDRNNINVRSAVNQQNSGDTDANSYGSADANANGGNGCGDCAADNAANNGGQDANGMISESVQSPENGQNQVEEDTQGITSDPFILPFSGN